MDKTGLILAAVALTGIVSAAGVRPAQTEKAAIGAWGFDLTGMDTSVKPGDDFFEYANGNWFKNADSADRTSIGSFQELSILEKRMKAIGRRTGKPARADAEEHQILDLYDGFTDTAGDRGAWPDAEQAGPRAHRGAEDAGRRRALMGDPALSPARGHSRRPSAPTPRIQRLCRDRRAVRPRHAEPRLLSEADDAGTGRDARRLQEVPRDRC